VNITIENLTFRYNPEVTALRDVSLSIESGESLAILGENGAGKSTLAKHLNGLLQPEKGRVLVGDWDTRERSPAELAQRVTYTFQNPDDQLFERTVVREVSFGPKNLGLSEKEVSARVEVALELTGLTAEAETHPYDLHATQRKFVALAASLAMQTPVLVIDEPTTGQDARGIERLTGILNHLKAEGRTIVTISHDIDFCAEQFNRAILMADAEVVADRPMTEVFGEMEAMRRSAIEPPQMIQLAQRLHWQHQPLTVEAFLELFRQTTLQKED
jgi:energy-coupling factor transport system ATP-binding protein